MPAASPDGRPAGPRERDRAGGHRGGGEVIELEYGITVYPTRDEHGRWRAVWHEDGARQQCEPASPAATWDWEVLAACRKARADMGRPFSYSTATHACAGAMQDVCRWHGDLLTATMPMDGILSKMCRPRLCSHSWYLEGDLR